MGNAYEIYALRYATMSPRTPNMNFLVPDPHETTALDLDYFVWLVRGGGRDILVALNIAAEPRKFHWQGRGRLLMSTHLDLPSEPLPGASILLRGNEGVIIALEPR